MSNGYVWIALNATQRCDKITTVTEKRSSALHLQMAFKTVFLNVEIVTVFLCREATPAESKKGERWTLPLNISLLTENESSPGLPTGGDHDLNQVSWVRQLGFHAGAHGRLAFRQPLRPDFIHGAAI